ncbi:hypothetical protein CRENBAI_007184 [Crenichthys baileyi]|uniref:Uncharacterized protein n=1 Tax=Crenichthys baileyi TaxID=28760 RepID=A0AAV9R1B0_9TELE
MAESRGNSVKVDEELPIYLTRPGTADQVTRQKRGGLFCSVEDAFDSKTIDFDALSVGQRGSRTSRTFKREAGQGEKGSESPAGAESPAGNSQEGNDSQQVEIRSSRENEALQNLKDEKEDTYVNVLILLAE